MREILDVRTVGTALAVVALWAVVVIVSGTGANWFSYTWDFANTGQFGDSFGSLSAIMASLAAFSALATFRITKAEIDRARENERLRLIEQAEEKKRAREREQIEDSRLGKAEFERTFFQLVSTFNALVADTDFVNQSKQHPQKGRDAFKAILGVFEYQRQAKDDAESYRVASQRFQNDLNHYFRFLYHVINFVDDNTEIKRYFYTRLIRALLSDSELALLSLNCIYGEGREKFKLLVEKYALLHNLSSHYRKLLRLDEFFEPSAFERSEVHGT